jgi:hypothetical protein
MLPVKQLPQVLRLEVGSLECSLPLPFLLIPFMYVRQLS